MGRNRRSGFVCVGCGRPKLKEVDGFSVIKGHYFCDCCASVVDEGELEPVVEVVSSEKVKKGCPDKRYWHLKYCNDCPRFRNRRCMSRGSTILLAKEVDGEWKVN